MFSIDLRKRWSTILAVALVTTALPAGVALAGPAALTGFPEGIQAGPSSFVGSASGGNGIALNVTSPTGTSIVAKGTIEAWAPMAIEAEGTQLGILARGPSGTGIKAEGSKYGVNASADTAVRADGSAFGVDASALVTAVKASTTNGTGVVATSTNGKAIDASSVNSSAVRAFSTKGTGVSATGAVSAVQAYADAANSDGVDAFGDRYGVYAEGRTAVRGQSYSGIGGEFSGAMAPIRLQPALVAGAPTSGTHKRGELYVDNQGNLFLCTADSTSAVPAGTWRKVHLD